MQIIAIFMGNVKFAGVKEDGEKFTIYIYFDKTPGLPFGKKAAPRGRFFYEFSLLPWNRSATSLIVT